jgi:coenzyme F420-reducing hydrogenase delta subunit
MVKDVHPYHPEIVLLYCQHCALDDAKVDVVSEKTVGFSVKPVVLVCSSKVEVSHIMRILERGADGVEVVACPADQCRLLVGSRRADKRVEYARELLTEIGVGLERVGISRETNLSGDDLMGLAEKRADAVRPLGPHPFSQTTDHKQVKGI